MCGFVGITCVRGRTPTVSDREVMAMRELLERRGPDGEGLERWENGVFAHRRLAILDPTASGKQPMATSDGRFLLVYNGELYNDAELRHELLAEGGAPAGFRTECDTETVLAAFAHWGERAFERMRGMFALAVYDMREHALHLARDPLGIKPLYFHVGSHELTFASSTEALLAHPAIEALPNMPMVSAYLTTLRTVLGGHTLFRDVQALQPGECLSFDTRSGDIGKRYFYHAPPVEEASWDATSASQAVRAALEDSVLRHMRSDVPICALLSGGIDSSIICRIASDHTQELATFCAGGTGDDAAEISEDFEYARLMAEDIASRHHEVSIPRERFAADWKWMVEQLGVPLSTPNEVAIHAVARELHGHGCKVALSGEGADELFSGYDAVMRAARDFLRGEADGRMGGAYQLDSTSWVPRSLKAHLFNPDAALAIQDDALVTEYFDATFERCRLEVGDAADPIEAHLRFLRHVNLTGLLGRLDTSTMLTSVEGRTPFSDVRVNDLADRIPLSLKQPGLASRAALVAAGAPDSAPGSTPESALAVDTNSLGKQVLRNAWAAELPESVRQRPKASFPMPFDRWMVDLAPTLSTSEFAHAIMNPGLLSEIAAEPHKYTQLAWPLINIALWGDRWWS